MVLNKLSCLFLTSCSVGPSVAIPPAGPILLRSNSDEKPRSSSRVVDSRSVSETFDYLKRWQSAADRKSVSDAYVRKHAQLAIQARREFPWAAQVPKELFLNDVAAYGVFTEARTGWRELMFTSLRPLLANAKTAAEALTIVNEKTWSVFTQPGKPPIHFIAAPPNGVNNFDPDQVRFGKYTDGVPGSSCTGLAIFLVCALRSVGFPARAAGAPHWNKGPQVCPHGDASPPCGNHNWAEVWIEGGWHFISPANEGCGSGERPRSISGGEGEKAAENLPAFLDHGWFYPQPAGVQTPQSGNHSIYATSWAPSKELFFLRNGTTAEEHGDLVTDHFVMAFAQPGRADLFNDHSVNGWDVTPRYLVKPALSMEKHEPTREKSEEDEAIFEEIFS